MTIEELLFGRRGEMTVKEFTYWKVFYLQKAKAEKEAAEDGSKKKTTRTQEFRKTMGGGNQPV